MTEGTLEMTEGAQGSMNDSPAATKRRGYFIITIKTNHTAKKRRELFGTYLVFSYLCSMFVGKTDKRDCSIAF
jgi:hypothetical protein